MKKNKSKVRRIKDLPKDQSLGGVKFFLPGTKQAVYWCSQWGYPNGKAGVWYKTNMNSERVFPLGLNNLEEALEFELAD